MAMNIHVESWQTKTQKADTAHRKDRMRCTFGSKTQKAMRGSKLSFQHERTVERLDNGFTQLVLRGLWSALLCITEYNNGVACGVFKHGGKTLFNTKWALHPNGVFHGWLDGRIKIATQVSINEQRDAKRVCFEMFGGEINKVMTKKEMEGNGTSCIVPVYQFAKIKGHFPIMDKRFGDGPVIKYGGGGHYEFRPGPTTAAAMNFKPHPDERLRPEREFRKKIK